MLSFNSHKNVDAQQQQAAQQQQQGTLSSSSVDSFDEEADDTSNQVADSDKRTLLRDEFLINMQKFATHISRTIQQIEGEIRLNVPELSLSGDVGELSKDNDLVHRIEGACLEWTKQISNCVETQLKKTPIGNGPLPEIDFWRERNATLSALSEQIKLGSVKKMLEILAKKDIMGDHAILQSFELHRSELNKYYVEAKDNVRFLSTLERHFKNLTHGAGFQVVLDTIPSMMNALRMVWIISR